MTSQSQYNYSSSTEIVNFDVKAQEFDSGSFGIPIAGKYQFPNGRDGSAIGEYLIPPSSGTFVLGSINGKIEWIQTEDCE